MAVFDISKAFDKASHYALFNKLPDGHVPVCLIHVLVNWYGKSNAVVRWNGVTYHPLRILAGVYQGEVLSPPIFSVYIGGVVR